MRMLGGFRQILAVFLVFLLTSCAWFRPPDKLVLQQTSFDHIHHFEEDNLDEAMIAFLKSCDAITALPDDTIIGQGELAGTADIWKSVCARAMQTKTIDASAAKEFFENNFMPFQACNNANLTGLFTGYYEPLLMGSRRAQPPFLYPVYGLPAEEARFYTREEIDKGALTGKAPILAYVSDPVALFFLQIQGSGRIEMPDGDILRLGYAGANGEKYVAIGKVLVDRGILKKEDVTMPVLRQWLASHPDEMWELLWHNPSYVFFRELAGDPVGTEQVPLTAGRSLAVDRRYIPLGMPVFVDTVLPATALSPETVHQKLFIAQDTGGAIHGPVRGDIFFGTGARAEALAGSMKAQGTMTLLVPYEIAVPLIEAAHETQTTRAR